MAGSSYGSLLQVPQKWSPVKVLPSPPWMRAVRRTWPPHFGSPCPNTLLLLTAIQEEGPQGLASGGLALKTCGHWNDEGSPPG